MKKTLLLGSLCMTGAAAFAQQEKPNIIVIYIDDMGYADPACYGGNYVPTPNIDKMAEEGIRFTQYYSACPISSPSRVGITTGMYPTRWGITTFLQDRAGNARNQQNDFLDARAPTMARIMQSNGYATGHFGKWHMGGGRDVDNAPAITKYGFDEYVSTWESPDPDPVITSANWIWDAKDQIKRWDRTAYFVEKTLDFLEKNKEKNTPCFINLWPDDVHTPWVYENDGGQGRESETNFKKVLAELDVQIGVLMAGIKDLGIDKNTLVIFTSDNGPAPGFDGKRTDKLRGQKRSLHEGGIRMPFIVRWPGKIEAKKSNNEVNVNTESVLCSVDLIPTLAAITGATLPTQFSFDGEDMSKALLGEEEQIRTKTLFWEFGKNEANRISPHIAVREGDWKLLVNADGSGLELYNMKTDYLEKTNVATSNPAVVNRLKPMAIEWFEGAFRELADNAIYVAVDGDASKDGSNWENATTLANAASLAKEYPGAQIWLKAGTYTLSSSIDFSALTIYGGFVGTEKKLTERNWKTNQSILDGGNTVSPLRTVSGGSTLDGVVVQNGLNQNGANGNANGGGMIVAGGSTIRNCIFRNNKTQDGKNGAAIHCHTGSTTIENSLFVNNTSTGNGGAVQVGGGATATIINSTFVNNQAANPGGAFGLGNDGSNLTLINTIAYNNKHGEAYSSLGQNININGGGTVISKNSAIESESQKLSTGNHVNHISLKRTDDPGFVAPAAVVGNTTMAIINAASYQLKETSLCVDAGDISLAKHLTSDLAMERRFSGTQIDIGAYEFDNGEPVVNDVIHVAPNGDENKDGSSWANATTLTKAVTLAGLTEESQIWLKAGTYTVNASINFKDLTIYGGFDGTEDQLEKRDWHKNASIIDGGNAVSPLRTVDGGGTLDGVIVQHGVNQTGASGNGNGGAMIVADGTKIRNCIFRNNKTQNGTNGAAIHCHLGNVTIENSLFVNNTSSGNGGAIQVGGSTSATIINCTFANNKASKPGGAFGLGNDSSNLTLINTIAYDNLYGETYNSFGQNENINGGGTVISKHSAIESASTKFSDGDDVNHITLSRDKSPNFVAPASVIGNTTMEIINAASYLLKGDSPCIDAGLSAEATNISLDLASQDRLQGKGIDIGAYEFTPGTGIKKNYPLYNIAAYTIENKLHVVGAQKGQTLRLFDVKGQPIHTQQITAEAEETIITLTLPGVYFVQVGEIVLKVIY